MKKMAIIGSGLSGLTLAHLLKDRFEITLFEKARSPGGRLATRRTDPYAFDHGAQYFTARTDAFHEFIQPLIDRGLIKKWAARHARFEGNKMIERTDWTMDEPRYVGVPGMNSIARHLAQDLDVRLNTKISSLNQLEKWQLIDEQGLLYDNFESVISALPAPQALMLLPEKFAHHAEIKTIEMRGCVSLMLGFSKRLPLEFDAAHITHSDISWIAVNSNKPGRGDLFTLMVHSSEAYAEENFTTDRQKVINHLCHQTSQVLGHDVSNADFKTVHSWRYANNSNRDTYPPFADHDLKLAACGDWCLGGRVEGAFTSALNLAEALNKRGD
ncbi:MAG: FAD-dependent oxidoreductase [Proteobacteria bacterium]|nr:FAD-dependent oxidoreductase [Pseudomonadota bacterium]